MIFTYSIAVSIGLVWNSDRPDAETVTAVARSIGTTILLQDVSSGLIRKQKLYTPRSFPGDNSSDNTCYCSITCYSSRIDTCFCPVAFYSSRIDIDFFLCILFAPIFSAMIFIM